ncbi:MAG: hypothetical protein ACXABY_29550 [Candidatus Thorarchaeota archaeon]|jgi:hypothetical protein
MVKFTREQLTSKDYNPLEDLDVKELSRTHYDYLIKHGVDAIDHVAAVRGILVRRPKTVLEASVDRIMNRRGLSIYDLDPVWGWIWDWGKLHDEILAESSFLTLFGRYRNQYGMLPRVEFEPGADIRAALGLLLEAGVAIDDLLHIEVMGTGITWMSIADWGRMRDMTWD